MSNLVLHQEFQCTQHQQQHNNSNNKIQQHKAKKPIGQPPGYARTTPQKKNLKRKEKRKITGIKLVLNRICDLKSMGFQRKNEDHTST